MTIGLAQFGDISERLEELHDCPFDLDQAQFDAEAQEWEGRFLRPVWEGPDVRLRRRALLLAERRVPVVEARLRFHSVFLVQILDDQRIGRYTFNRVARSGNGLRLQFNEGMQIELAFRGEPTASYEEVPAVGIRAVYRDMPFLHSGPTLEFEPGSTSLWAV